MIGLVLVTHAGLAGALVRSAEMIIGKIENCELVEINSDEKADQVMTRVVAAVGKVSAGGTIIITDLFGGTPSNMAMSFLKDGSIEVIAGANLPMVIEFCSKREQMNIPELASAIHKAGREGIIVAGDLLK
jgi:PTS system mannose-specific IIA component